ncbi:TPA: LPD38 domain-containing protein [Photobacterium damselae]
MAIELDLSQFDFPTKPSPNYEVNAADLGLSVVAGGLRGLQGATEAAVQLDNAGAASQSMSASALRHVLLTSPLTAAGLMSAKPMHQGLGQAATWVEQARSDDAQAAAKRMPASKTPQGDWQFSTDPAIYGVQLAQSLGYIAPSLLTMIATGGTAASLQLKPAITRLMLRMGMSKSYVQQALPYALRTLESLPAAGVGTLSDLGMQGEQNKTMALEAPHEQLMQSPHYRQAFLEIDGQAQYHALSDRAKFALARRHVGDRLSQATMQDPRNVTASVAATLLGDVALARALLRGTGRHSGLKGAMSGLVSGSAREGSLESLQEGIQQRVANETANHYLAKDGDPNTGVAEASVNGLILGGISGGGLNAAGGMRASASSSMAPSHPTQTSHTEPIEGNSVGTDNVDPPPSEPAIDDSSSREQVAQELGWQRQPEQTWSKQNQAYEEVVEAVLDEWVHESASQHPEQTQALVAAYESGALSTHQFLEQLGALQHESGSQQSQLDSSQPTAQAADTASDEKRAQSIASSSHQARSSTESASPLTSPPIVDVGEKMGGARKDLWQRYRDKLPELDATTLARQSLQQTWPKPDYLALQKQGVSPEILSYFRAMRDSIPTKPKRPHQRQVWAENVHRLRRLATELLEGKRTPEDLARLGEQTDSLLLQRIRAKATLYQHLGHDKTLSAYTLRQGRYRQFQGEQFAEPTPLWTVEKIKTGRTHQALPRVLGYGPTQEAAMEQAKARLMAQEPAPSRSAPTFAIYQKTQESGFFIGKKIGREWVDLAGPIATKEAALRHRREETKSLTARWQQHKQIPAHRDTQDVPRVGPTRRKSPNVSATEFASTFGFRGVEFGNWVEQSTRQQMLNDAFDALMDMAAVLALPPKALSLNGELGLALGARGVGGPRAAKAHYEPGKVVINLTKKRGAGSLGHEWWHALDHYFGKQADPKQAEMMTALLDTQPKALMIRAQMQHAFQGVMHAIRQTALPARSTRLDRRKTKDYWSTSVEMSARSFESYLIAKMAHNQHHNRFLANVVSEDRWSQDSRSSAFANEYPYPLKQEQASIHHAFDHFFSVIKPRPHATGQVALLSKEALTPASSSVSTGLPRKRVEALAAQWRRDYQGGADVNILVVQTQQEAEDRLGAAFPHHNIHAFYQPQQAQVVLVADHLPHRQAVHRKLRHEVLVHHGLRHVLGEEEYGAVISTVYQGLSSRYLRGLVRTVERHYDREAHPDFAEEVLAYAAEKERTRLGQWWDRFIASIMTSLRRVGLARASDLTQAEIHRLVDTLERRVRFAPKTRPGSSRVSQPNRAEFPDFEADVKWARTAASQSQANRAFHSPKESFKAQVIRKLVDKFQVLKALQENIQASGHTINESEDVYLAEELFHGKAENDLRLMTQQYVEPLAKLMAQHHISQTQLDTYLIARHAQERNAYIASFNPKFPDAGSGMGTQEAKQHLARLQPQLPLYEQLADIVYDMSRQTREVLKASGLMHDTEVDSWQHQYRYYVPLKGQALDELNAPRTGRGLAVGGKEVKAAKGRRSQAVSPSSQVILDLTEKLIRARKNEVGQTLLALVRANPAPDYWQIFTSERPDTTEVVQQVYDPNTQKSVKTLVKKPVPMESLSQYYFPTKHNGKTYYIKLRDPRLMKAMTQLGLDPSNALLATLGQFNRYLSAVNTSYNPEFIVTNFVRDLQTALLNLSSEQTRDDGAIRHQSIVKQVLADVNVARKAIYLTYRGKKGKTETLRRWQQEFEAFLADGAKTGWFDMKDIKGQTKAINRLVAMAAGTYKGKAFRVFDAVTGLVEDMNASIENAVRLSAYVHARRANISRRKAASLAKNMTVNFNRRGEVGVTLNALFLFANASIQGSRNFVRTMGGLKNDGTLRWRNLNLAQKIAVGLVMGNFWIAWANRQSAGEDDDGENWFDKVPSYVKERNLVFMKSLFGGPENGEYFSIPMPYGYNLFAVLGTSIEASVHSPTISVARAAGNVAKATISAFSPIGLSDSQSVSSFLLKNLTPTIGKPFLETALNENFAGIPLYRENLPFDTAKPQSELGRANTGRHYTALAKWLNQVTGGSAFRPGMIDVNPDVLKYIVSYYGGAAWRFVDVKIPGLLSALSGQPAESRHVAFLSRVSGRVMPYAQQKRYYELRETLLQWRDEYEAAKGPDRRALLSSQPDFPRMWSRLQRVERQLRALRTRRKKIYAAALPSDIKHTKIKETELQMKRVMDSFLARYHQTKKSPYKWK